MGRSQVDGVIFSGERHDSNVDLYSWHVSMMSFPCYKLALTEQPEQLAEQARDPCSISSSIVSAILRTFVVWPECLYAHCVGLFVRFLRRNRCSFQQQIPMQKRKRNKHACFPSLSLSVNGGEVFLSFHEAAELVQMHS